MYEHFKMSRSVLQRAVLTLLILGGIAAPLAAQPTWSGNASVDAGEFVNFVDDIPLAGASSSFTRNTLIQVTNPQNNKTVEITIVKRAPRPGVFLVLSAEAGKALAISSDQVVEVQVQVVESSSNEYDEFKSIDPDINPAVTVPSEDIEEVIEPPVETASEKIDIPEETIPDAGNDFTTAPVLGFDELVPVPIPVDDLRVDRAGPETEVAEETIPEETVPEEIILPGTAVEDAPEITSTVPLEEDIPEFMSDETVDMSSAEELDDTMLPSGDNVIYFLTPSDFRPPTQPIESKEESEEIIPVLVDRDALADYIVSQLNNGSSYIQLGAYSTADSIYNEIEAIEARYPMVVWTEQKNGKTLYKLLIGPLTQDETGVLSYRFRDSGYADLFLYKP